jgi:hypothetical protein
MDFDHGDDHVVTILPDGLSGVVLGIFEALKVIPVKVALFYEYGLHVMVVFGLPAELLANTAEIFEGIVRRPAFLPFDTPPHGFQHVPGPILVLLPGLSGVVVVGNFGQPPPDLAGRFVAKPRSNADHLQVRHGAYTIDGSLDSVGKAEKNRFNHILAGLGKDITADDHHNGPLMVLFPVEFPHKAFILKRETGQSSFYILGIQRDMAGVAHVLP